MDQVRLARREDSNREYLELPEDVGACYCERISLENDLILVRLRYRPTCNLKEETINPHGRHMLAITFGLEGQSGYRGTEGTELLFRAGFTTVAAFCSSHGERHYVAGNTVSQLRLLVGEQTLSKYLGQSRARALLGGKSIQQLAFRKSSRVSQGHATALASAFCMSSPNLLDMHFHSLALLSEQLRPIAPPTPESSSLSWQDVEALESVRDLMLERLDQPLTIPHLCAATGLNEFKLKEGFHKHFNTTPHRMLHDLRMRKAHALLESGCQVAQAAYQCGYRHPSNFSTAFSSFFGYPPKSLCRKFR
ncbi:AraC family transcriptional regulator [Halomonas huangheensis]|nr:AraC family transcriptional regulator [Halomonas huangheensis]